MSQGGIVWFLRLTCAATHFLYSEDLGLVLQIANRNDGVGAAQGYGVIPMGK